MQDNIKDCGIASLLTIIKTHGGSVPYEYLRVLTNTSKEGTNAYYLFEAAKTLGFDTRALKGDVKDLDKSLLPCIAHVIIDSRYKHFVVIHDINSRFITVADPSWGIRKFRVKEFNKISTNKFLIFIPNKIIPNIKEDKTFVNLILKSILKYKNTIITIFIFSLFYTLLNILLSYGFQFVIEDAINTESLTNLYFIAGNLFIFTLLKHLTDYMRTNLFNYVNNRVDFILTNNVFRHILSLPYMYYKTRSTGDILSRINDLNSIREALCNLFMYLFVDGVLVVIVFFFLLKLNLTLTIISSLVIVLYFLIIKLFSERMHDLVLENQQNISKVNTCLIESIEATPTIKSLVLEREFGYKLSDIYNKYLNKNYRLVKFFNIQSFFKDLTNSIGLVLVLIIGGYFVLKNKMTLESLITYNALILYFLEPLKNIADFDLHVKKSKVAIRRIRDLYGIQAENYILDKKYSNINILGNIDINNLSYSYNGRDNLLKKINLNIKSGERILLCGDSGSGKSTLAKILVKYFEVGNNMIMIDDKDINDYNLIKIRRDICYVSQKEMLFSDSIYNNIVLEREVTYDKFLDICKKAHVDLIADKNISKYDFLIEENGFNISGGERQKIIIARSLLKESSIYIFDESFSELDIESEKNILTNIFELLTNKTIIVISHRFNNNELFDKVFTLKNGEIYNGCCRV